MSRIIHESDGKVNIAKKEVPGETKFIIYEFCLAKSDTPIENYKSRAPVAGN
jgi:hypothetical protein